MTTVAAVLLAAVLRPRHHEVLGWDEVGQVAAARLGWWTNAWDEGSLSPTELLDFIHAKWERRPPALPRDYDEERDPLLMRSLHGPFIAFLIVPVAWSMHESLLRVGQLAGAWALLAALVLAHRRISPSVTLPGMAVVAILAVWAGRLLFHSVNCHGWMTVWTLASTVALGQWLATRDRKWGVAAAGFLALTAVTLHTGLVVLGGAATAVLLLRRVEWRTLPLWREVAVGASIVVGVTLLLWPGSVTKLSMVRIFAQYAYLMNIGKEWASSDDRMGQNAVALLPLLSLMPVLCWWLFDRKRSARALWVPALTVCVFYAIPVVPHMVTPIYLLPALAPLIPFMGWLVDSQPRRWRRWGLVLTIIALVGLSWRSKPIANTEEHGRREDLLWLQYTLLGQETLADGAHMLRHYLGPGYSIRTLWVTYEGDALLLRERGEYRPLTPLDSAGRFVLIEARRPGFPGNAERISSLLGCALTLRPTLLAFDCRETVRPRGTPP